MKKVNLGCGNRYAKGWINLDVRTDSCDVVPHDLLHPLPFNDNEIDVIYCSHVLEHLSRAAGKELMQSCFNKLKPNGILRVVVPDLENVCREYLSILDNINRNENRLKYEWIIIELLDQFVRDKPGGDMALFWQEVIDDSNDLLIDYIKLRTGTDLRSMSFHRNESLIDRARKINLNRVKIKLIHSYVRTVRRLVPKTLRNTVADNTSVGEKHKWMYDKYYLKELLTEIGFRRVEFLTAETSNIDGFIDDYLDTNQDGTHYKESSIYCEALKVV